jgi:hypothetical protein
VVVKTIKSFGLTTKKSECVLSPEVRIIFTSYKFQFQILVKVKLSLCMPWRHMEECKYSLLIFKLGTRLRWVETFMPPANLSHGKSTEYPLNMRLDGTHRQSRCSVEKSLFLLPGIECFLGTPTCSTVLILTTTLWFLRFSKPHSEHVAHYMISTVLNC